MMDIFGHPTNMEPPKLNKKYFQKSKTFLFPLLGIKKTAPFDPTQTYVAWSGKYTPTKRKLICLYTFEDHSEFLPFERGILLSNRFYNASFNVNLKQKAFVFSFDKYRIDWMYFLNGRYSQLSTQAKNAIRYYFGEESDEYNLLRMYLFPELYKEAFAQALFAPGDFHRGVKLLEEVHELCDKCNLYKETYRRPWSWQLPLFHRKDLC